MFAPVIRMAREERVADPRLVYFGVPPDTAPGRYDVYVHNSLGGEFGWRKAGTVEALPRQKPAEKILDVRQFGAKGEGLGNDAQAIKEAVSAAQKDGGVVFFPPGTYKTDETILVPSGVSLRGASAENTVIEGIGYDPHANRRAWFTGRHAPGAPVVRLSDHTAVESLTIRGATSKGRGGVALIEAVPAELKFPATAEVTDLAIRRCRLHAQEDMSTGWAPYANRAVYVGPRSQRVRFISNEVFGGVDFREIRRLDMIDNRFHGGNVHASAYDSLVDANFFVDSPTRFLVYPRRHCHIRFNEVHQAHRSSWENAEEIFLVHGGGRKSFGLVTSASPTTLADKGQSWKPGFYKDATALIISGRGFGQYRTVADNTADTLTLESPWRVVPDQTSEYVVGAMHVENDAV